MSHTILFFLAQLLVETSFLIEYQLYVKIPEIFDIAQRFFCKDRRIQTYQVAIGFGI
jgi:hypothetical protein